MSELDNAPLPPELAKRFQPVRLLGQGSYGQVLEAVDLALGKSVAIKSLRLEQGSDVQRARFVREARITAGTLHPHLVKVLDFGILSDGSGYLIYELIEGGTLERFGPSGSKRASDDQVRRWAIELGGALEALHRKGIVHRDVKPANVLVRSDNSLVLADLGLARQPMSALTETGAVLGTPRYMGPEVWTFSPVTAAADQFSWASVFYEILSKFYATDICGKPGQLPPIPETWQPAWPPGVSVPLDLSRVILRGLRARPKDRYSSMTAAIADLKRGQGSGGEVRQEGSGGGETATASVILRRAPPRRTGTDPSPPRATPARIHRNTAVRRTLLVVYLGLAIGILALLRSQLSPSPSLSLPADLSLEQAELDPAIVLRLDQMTTGHALPPSESLICPRSGWDEVKDILLDPRLPMRVSRLAASLEADPSAPWARRFQREILGHVFSDLRLFADMSEGAAFRGRDLTKSKMGQFIGRLHTNRREAREALRPLATSLRESAADGPGSSLELMVAAVRNDAVHVLGLIERTLRAADAAMRTGDSETEAARRQDFAWLALAHHAGSQKRSEHLKMLKHGEALAAPERGPAARAWAATLLGRLFAMRDAWPRGDTTDIEAQAWCRRLAKIVMAQPARIREFSPRVQSLIRKSYPPKRRASIAKSDTELRATLLRYFAKTLPDQISLRPIELP